MNRRAALLLGAAVALCEGSCNDGCNCNLRDRSEAAKPADVSGANSGFVPEDPLADELEDDQNPNEGFDHDEPDPGPPVERACDAIAPTGTSLIAKTRDIATATRACCLEVIERGVRDDLAEHDIHGDDRNLRFRLSMEGSLDKWCQCAIPINPERSTYSDGFCSYAIRQQNFGEPESAYFVSTGPDGLCDGRNAIATRSNFVLLCDRSEGICRALEQRVCLDPRVRAVDETAGTETDYRTASEAIEYGRHILDEIRSAARRRP